MAGRGSIYQSGSGGSGGPTGQPMQYGGPSGQSGAGAVGQDGSLTAPVDYSGLDYDLEGMQADTGNWMTDTSRAVGRNIVNYVTNVPAVKLLNSVVSGNLGRDIQNSWVDLVNTPAAFSAKWDSFILNPANLKSFQEKYGAELTADQQRDMLNTVTFGNTLGEGAPTYADFNPTGGSGYRGGSLGAGMFDESGRAQAVSTGYGGTTNVTTKVKNVGDEGYIDYSTDRSAQNKFNADYVEDAKRVPEEALENSVELLTEIGYTEEELGDFVSDFERTDEEIFATTVGTRADPELEAATWDLYDRKSEENYNNTFDSLDALRGTDTFKDAYASTDIDSRNDYLKHSYEDGNLTDEQYINATAMNLIEQGEFLFTLADGRIASGSENGIYGDYRILEVPDVEQKEYTQEEINYARQNNLTLGGAFEGPTSIEGFTDEQNARREEIARLDANDYMFSDVIEGKERPKPSTWDKIEGAFKSGAKAWFTGSLDTALPALKNIVQGEANSDDWSAVLPVVVEASGVGQEVLAGTLEDIGVPAELVEDPDFMAGVTEGITTAVEGGDLRDVVEQGVVKYVEEGGSFGDSPLLAELALNIPDLGINLPEFDIDLPSVDIDLPEVNIDLPEVDINLPEFNTPEVDINLPEFNTPSVDIGLPSVDIGLPSVDIDLPSVDLPSVDLNIGSSPTRTTDALLGRELFKFAELDRVLQEPIKLQQAEEEETLEYVDLLTDSTFDDDFDYRGII
tara:strand:- start:1909 stop:4122 length:2214 start_codon:yes stop_codon:yes gene_type:complete